MATPSKSQADKAGDRLKKFVRDGGSLQDIDETHERHGDVLVVQQWRRQFSGALAGTVTGLKSMIRTCDIEGESTQRLKRVERIVQKLVRPQTTRVSAMQDIAGVRAVVPTVDDLRKFQQHIEHQWCADVWHTSGIIQPDRTTDYIVHPRSSGYRAVHLIVDYNDLPVEIQLRTSNQHFWADLSERISRDIDVELKAGDGPLTIATFFVELGDRIGAMDDGADDPWRLTLDLRPWEGEILSVSYDP